MITKDMKVFVNKSILDYEKDKPTSEPGNEISFLPGFLLTNDVSCQLGGRG